MATRRTKKGTTETWPLGDYLRKMRGTLSVRQAARIADISEARWRQVEAGYQQMAGGLRAPVHPRAETVAAMCRAVSADVQEGLRLAGHNPEHYPWLIEPPTEVLDDAQLLDWFSGLPREDREEVLAELQRKHLDAELERQQAAPVRRRRSGTRW